MTISTTTCNYSETWKGNMMFFKKKKVILSKTLIEMKPIIENGVRWYKVSWLMMDGNFYVDSGAIDYFEKKSDAEKLVEHCVKNGVPKWTFTVENQSC